MNERIEGHEQPDQGASLRGAVDRNRRGQVDEAHEGVSTHEASGARSPAHGAGLEGIEVMNNRKRQRIKAAHMLVMKMSGGTVGFNHISRMIRAAWFALWENEHKGRE